MANYNHRVGNINKLNICYWNADSINNKKLEFAHFLHVHKIAVAMLQETFLSPHNKLSFKGYTIYRNDRQGAGGGTAVMIKNGISHNEVQLPAFQRLEATAVSIDTKNGPLNLISAYNKPNSKLINAELDSIFHLGTSTIIAGDLNAKSPNWNSKVTNQTGQLLQDYAARENIAVMGPDQPTHFPYGRPNSSGDVLDIVVFKNFNHPIMLTSVPALTSDHNPVLLQIGTDVTHLAPPNRIKIKNIDFEKN